MPRNGFITPRKLLAFLVCVVLLWILWAVFSPIFTQNGDLDSLISLRDNFNSWVQTLNPWYLIIAFAVLSIFGVPIYPFYIAAAAFDPRLMLPAIAVSLLFNMAVSYWMALGIFNPLILSFMDKRGWTLPKPESHDYLILLLAVRMCGFPFTIQNWFLALVGVPFRMYLWVSFIIEILIAAAVLFLGDALLHGKTSGIIFGCCFVLGFILCCYHIRKNWIGRFMELADSE